MSEAAAIPEGPSAGTLLREAREAAGLHTATLAASLKVPVRKLEALEEDRYDLLPDAVFVRALASSICRTLKVDPQPVLERLPQTASPRLVQENVGLNTPFRAPNDAPGPGFLSQVSRPVVLTVVALLLGALVLIFLPWAQRGYDTLTQAAKSEPGMPPPGAAATVPNAPAPAAETVAGTVPAEPASASGPVPTASAITPVPDPRAAPDAPVAATPARAAASTPVVAVARPAASAPAAIASVAAAPQAAASGPIDARGIVAFRTKGPSWIQVTDATGATVFRKQMEAGESAGASGTLPLAVTIGSVAATEVQVRGKPYNLGPVSRDNVARFEIK